jgi:carbonic anhydrase
MRKTFHFDTAADHYVAEAVVLCCFDHRFQQVTRKFVKREGIAHPDWIVVAGGAKTLASPGSDFERDYFLQQIRLSINLHGTRRVILTCHSDCGAYGGLAAHRGDSESEAKHHWLELRRARDLVANTFPELQVETYLIDFEGVWSEE